MDIISNEELKEQLHNQFEAFIKSRNKRQTQERYKILDKIVERGSHFDIDDLYTDLESTYHVSRATVLQHGEPAVRVRNSQQKSSSGEPDIV